MFTTEILVVLGSPTAGSLHMGRLKEQRPYREI